MHGLGVVDASDVLLPLGYGVRIGGEGCGLHLSDVLCECVLILYV